MHTHTLRAISKVILILGAVVLAGSLIWVKANTGSVVNERVADVEQNYYHATIASVTEVDGKALEHDPNFSVGARELQLTITLDDGRTVSTRAIDDAGLFVEGRRVLMRYQPLAPEELRWGIADVDRFGRLMWLTLAFVVAVLALMGWQGVTSLVGLAMSIGMILFIVAPAVLDGHNALLIATLGAMAVMWITLPLSHGLNWTTAAAMLGTAAALLLTVFLTYISVEGTFITGLTNEDAINLRYQTDKVLDLKGLLMAGIVIGTLGVLDDVTVSQASTVAQLRAAAPKAPRARIVAGALKVGRDHLAASVNTLFLAYAGASLPLLMFFIIGGVSFQEQFTSEIVAQEVVRTLAGSIGLVAAVPLTTLLAALILDEDSAVIHDHDHGAPHPVEQRLIDLYHGDDEAGHGHSHEDEPGAT